MEPKIAFTGFTPTKDFVALLNEKLFRLSAICPYDSSLTLNIVLAAKRYDFSLVVRFVDGTMESETHGPNLNKAMLRCIAKLNKQVYTWHTGRFENAAAVPPEVAIAPPEPVIHKPSVLIIDDDPVSTQFLEFCLKRSGCTTTNVSSGHSAVHEIASQKYDMIFLDWNMPDMNGGETLLSAQNLISYDAAINRQFSDLKMPVITYSGRPKMEIKLPQCKHFRFVDHWDKSTPFHQLLHQAADVLFRFKAVQS